MEGKKIFSHANLLSSGAPVRVCRSLVCLWNAGVSSPSPKPTIDINGLQVLRVAAFAFEVAFTAGGPNGADIICQIRMYTV